MNNLSAGLQEYYRAVEREIPCSGKDKKRYLNDILQSLTNLQDEQPDAGYETAIMRIGAPESLGETAKDTMDAADFAKQRRHNTKFKIIAAAILVVAVVLVGVFGNFYLRYKEALEGDFIVDSVIYAVPEGTSKEDAMKFADEVAQRWLEMDEETNE